MERCKAFDPSKAATRHARTLPHLPQSLPHAHARTRAHGPAQPKPHERIPPPAQTNPSAAPLPIRRNEPDRRQLRRNCTNEFPPGTNEPSAAHAGIPRNEPKTRQAPDAQRTQATPHRRASSPNEPKPPRTARRPTATPRQQTQARPDTPHALAVRPRCARAPGSPRHLLHHPPVYAKILTTPSTPPDTGEPAKRTQAPRGRALRPSEPGPAHARRPAAA